MNAVAINSCFCEFGSDDERCCIAKARACNERVYQHKPEKPKGRWLKVECYGFMPEGGSLSHDLGDYTAFYGGMKALGFTVMDDLSIKEIP